MGIVYQTNKGLIKDYPSETAVISDIVIEPGRPSAAVQLAELSTAEVDKILMKLDTLAMQLAFPAVATILAEEAQSVLVAVRMCKVETHEAFMGVLGVGSNLDMCWLRAVNVGAALMNSAGTAACGPWAQASGVTEPWLFNHAAVGVANFIPTQTMAEEATVIHFGTIDPIEVPKLDSIMFTLAGIPSPAQSLEYRIRKQFGTNQEPIVRFEKPIIVGPEKRQLIQCHVHTIGDDKTQLLSLLIGEVEDLLLVPAV